MPQRYTRYQKAQSVIKSDGHSGANHYDYLTSQGEYKVTRSFPAISSDAQRIQCAVTVSSFPSSSESVYKSVKTALGFVYVQGLASDLPSEVADDVNPIMHELGFDAQRILSFGLLYMKRSQRKSVYISL